MRTAVRQLLRLVLPTFLLLAFVASNAFAQLPTGTILGTVRDTSGAIVPGADVTVRNVDTGLTRNAVAGDNGSYRFNALPVGSYEVRAELQGFRTQVRTGLTLTVGQEIVVNMALEVGAVTETVSVSAEAPLVNTTSGALGGLVDEQRIAELPLNGRNYVELTLLQTGVSQHKSMNLVGGLSGVWYSSNGAPPRSNNLMLDGAPMQNLFGATSSSISGSTLGVDGIQEYRVVTNSFSAEYGMTMGSQMTLVSKSGTNRMTGSIFEYHRNSAFDSRNFFDREKPPFTRNNFGAAIGGPVAENQTFFHLTYEGVRQELGITRVSNVFPREAKVDGGLVPRISPIIRPILDLFPDPNLPNNQYAFSFTEPLREDYGQGRVDHNFSQNDTFFARYTIHDAGRTQVLNYPDFRTDGASRSQYATVSENHIFSSALLNTARLSYSRTTIRFDSQPAPSGPGFTFMPGKDLAPITIGGITTLGPDQTTPTDFKQGILTLSDDLFYTRGAHSMKFGMLLNWYQQYMLNSGLVRGSATFPNIPAFLLAQPVNFTAITTGSIVDRDYHYTTVGSYFQDDWQAHRNVTVNLGLRYEFATEPEEVNGLAAAIRDIRRDTQTTLGQTYRNPSLKNISPRLGFAWDVMGNGRTALRGGFGRLYDIGNLGSALLIGASATPPFSTRSTVAGPAAAQLFSIPLTFPATAVGRGARIMDYLIEQPYMHQFNLTVERQLPGSMAVTLAYAGSRGYDLISSTEGNPTIPTILADGRKFWPAGAPRINPAFDSIELKTAQGRSWYNALQFGVLKRLSHGLQFQSSYTWSKALDDTQGQLGAEISSSSIFPSDPDDLSRDKGPSSFDVEHNWRFNAIYHLPQTDGAARALLNGWWVSGIVSMQTGYPFTPTLNSNRSRSGVSGGAAGIDRPDLVQGVDPAKITSGTSRGCVVAGRGIAPGTPLGTPQLWFDPCAFGVPQAGFLGNAGRNILRGPGFATVDLSLAKDTEVQFLGGAKQVQFRMEIFNILNRTNFALPSGTVLAAVADVEAPLPTAGVITRTASTARQVQFAIKFLF